MATTDQAVLSELQYQVIEPTVDNGVTWTSALWTAAEVLDSLNQRQRRFMKDTLLVMSYTTVTAAIGSQTHALPVDWVVTYRADWKDDSSGQITELPRSSTFEIDHATPAWAQANAPRPLLYDDTETDTTTFQTLPTPAHAGHILLLYVALTTELTGAGVNFTVPDEFVPAVKYGVLADMLRKLGRAHDATRADYCEQRYQEGVEAASMILNGWGEANHAGG